MKNNNTLMIIKNHILQSSDQWLLLNDVHKTLMNEFEIISAVRIFFNTEFYEQFYSHLSEKFFFQNLCNSYSGDAIVVQIIGINIINRIRELIGPTDPNLAEDYQIRKKYGINIQFNAVHSSEDYETYLREKDLIDYYIKHNLNE